MLFPLVSLPVRVCVCVSLRQCSQLSTLVRDHRGKSFPEKWAVLPSAPIQPRRPAHGGSGGTFPFSD